MAGKPDCLVQINCILANPMHSDIGRRCVVRNWVRDKQVIGRRGRDEADHCGLRSWFLFLRPVSRDGRIRLKLSYMAKGRSTDPWY